jgi:glycopeptide antibiotics resistance protein
MVHFFPYPFITGLVVLVLILVVFRMYCKPISRPIIFSLMWVYLLLVIGLTLFPIPYNWDYSTLKLSDQIAMVFSRINWIPFHNWSWTNGKSQLFEIVNNILLTIPFGFLMNFYANLNWKSLLLISVTSGLAIEISQFILSLFFGPYRTVDINDVILNAIGFLIGCLIFITAIWFVHTPRKLTRQ